MDEHQTPLTILLYNADLWQHVCPTIRVIAPAHAAGIHVLEGTNRGNGTITCDLEKIAQADLVILQRDFPHYEALYEEVVSAARNQHKKIVYEVDDLLFSLGENHPDYRNYRPARSAILRAVIEADAITTSSPELYDTLRNFNQNIFLLPNYLPDELWRASLDKPLEEDDRPDIPTTIGYMGGHSHASDLESISAVLKQIAEQYGDQILFKFWGCQPPLALRENENVEFIDVGLVDYSEFSAYFSQQQCDIFIAPLLDTQFNRHKSNLKFLEYGALALPAVYSNVTPYANIVNHGQNGFLATDEGEWHKHLTALIVDAELRYHIGGAARETVAQEWLLSNHAHQWVQTYEQILNQEPLEPLSQSVDEDFRTDLFVRLWHDWHTELEQEITAKDSSIRDLENQLAETTQVKDHEIATKDHEIATKDHEIGMREHEIEIRGHALAAKDEEIVFLQGVKRQLEHEKELAELTVATLEETVNRKQDDLHQFNTLLMEKDQVIQNLNGHIEMINNSPGWKALQAITPLRYRAIPVGSRREQALQLGIHSAGVLRREGIRSFWTKARREMKLRQHRGYYHDVHGYAFPIVIQDGERITDPFITIVTIIDQGQPAIENVLDWASGQTINSIQQLVWNVQTKQVSEYIQTEGLKDLAEVDDILNLLDHATGRYLCIASDELIHQRATYLEENLVTLQSESLAFTINANGDGEYLLSHLRLGRLPGNEQLPLSRMVVRTDCLTERWNLDLSNFSQATHEERRGEEDLVMNRIVAGRLIPYTTNAMDTEDTLSCDRGFNLSAFQIAGQYLLLTEQTPADELTTHLLSPVDTVLPLDPDVDREDERPTVVLISSLLAMGGAEQLALYMIEHLKDDIRFVVVAMERHDLSLGTTEDKFRALTPHVYVMADFVLQPLYFSFMTYLLERFTPQTLYIANGCPWIYDALGTLKQHHPDLWTVNQVYDHRMGWINRYNPDLVNNTDAHIGTSDKICDAYIERGATPEQVHQIEHCVDPNEFDWIDYDVKEIERICNQLGIPKGHKVITFMARVHSQKRPMDYVELARRFRDHKEMTFLFIGDGPLASVVDEEIERIGLTNIVRHPFYRPSRDIFAITDVFVLPSEYEGMPLVLLEAQCMGVPCVVTDAGNNRAVFDITEGGVVIDQIGDITALYNGILEMLEGPPDPIELRKAVTDKLSQEFHILPEQMGESFRNVLLPSQDKGV